MISSIWQRLSEITIAGNELWRLLVFFAVVLLSLVIGRLARWAMLRRAASPAISKEWHTVLFRTLARPVVFLSFTAGLWLCDGSNTLQMPETAASIFGSIVYILNTVAIGFVLFSLVSIVDHSLGAVAGRTQSKVDDMLAPLVGKSIRVTILVLVAVQVVQSLSDKPVTSLLAGLGVGGLAVALAGQDTLKNFFGSIVILADRPFEIGDRVVIDGHDGPVETVGFRSTKIRTLDGHLVTVPNSEVVVKTIQNVGKRPHIKRIASITVTYDTPPAKVERAVEIIKEILANHEGMAPDYPPRVYFDGFNDCSLNIRMIYWYHPADYWLYMAFSERVNMQILSRFNEAGIDFAFPTQTIHLAGRDVRVSGDSTPA